MIQKRIYVLDRCGYYIAYPAKYAKQFIASGRGAMVSRKTYRAKRKP